MALVFDSRFRALDSSGNAYSGALLYVYDANTLNLASIYTTSALSVALSNPVVADSAGRFAQIFAVEGATFDLVLKTSAGVTLTSYDDVVAMGSNTGIITRDFTNSRLRVAGAGGIISVEAGDPTGDDVGGQLRLGGYSGSQAVSLSLDALATNTTGKFTENSKKLPGIVYTEATTFTAASTVDITLPNDPVGCRAWDVDIWDLSMSAATQLNARLSYNGGSTYAAGATDYDWFYFTGIETVATVDPVTAGPTTSIRIANDIVGVANVPGRVSFRVMTPRTGNNVTTVEGRSSGVKSTGDQVTTIFMGSGPASSGPCDHIRILPASGTITGKYRVTPLRGFGEV